MKSKLLFISIKVSILLCILGTFSTKIRKKISLQINRKMLSCFSEEKLLSIHSFIKFLKLLLDPILIKFLILSAFYNFSKR